MPLTTVTYLLENTDDPYSELDLGQFVGLVLVNLNAFDTVDHEMLCLKLELLYCIRN